MKPPITYKGRMSVKTGRCELCKLETAPDSSFCPTHTGVEKNLREAYDAWNVAYGSVALTAFFDRLIKLPETGDRVKELIRLYHNNPGKWK